MGDDVMRPAFNFEPKYRVTMLTKEEWNRGPGTTPAVKGLVWYTDGSRTRWVGWGWGGGGELGSESMGFLREGGPESF